MAQQAPLIRFGRLTLMKVKNVLAARLRLEATDRVTTPSALMTWTTVSSGSSAARAGSSRLHRIGFTPQVPVHRAAERDEAAIAAWRGVTWVKLRG